MERRPTAPERSGLPAERLIHLRAPWIAAVLLGLLALGIGVALPSRDVEPDALDELLCVESPRCRPHSLHPLAEQSVWVGMHALYRLGYTGRAVRPVQLWNAGWMSLALALIYWLAFDLSGRSTIALATSLVVASTYAFVHWLIDPYLFYWPPALAAAVGTVLLIRRDMRFAATACACLTVLFNLLCAAFLLPAAWLALRRRGPGFAAAVSAVPLLIVGLLGRNPSHVAISLYGQWRANWWPSVRLGAGHAVMAHPFQLDGTAWSAALRAIAGWAVVVALVAVVVDLVRNGRRGLAASWSWLAAAAAAALFMAWWDPEQGMFWFLPLVLLVLGWAASAPKGRLAAAFLLAASLPTFASSVTGYAWRAAHSRVDRSGTALRIAARFRSTDRLVYPGFADAHVLYFGRLECFTLVALHSRAKQRGGGLTTFDLLDELIRASRTEGRRVFLETGVDDQPDVPGWLAASGVDYGPADFSRFSWGETVRVEGVVFREMLGLRAQPP